MLFLFVTGTSVETEPDRVTMPTRPHLPPPDLSLVRRHRWELHPHPPGFDLYVLGGAGRHQARPLAEYQWLGQGVAREAGNTLRPIVCQAEV